MSASVPTLRYAVGSRVAVGDRLGTVRQVSSGVGTYVRGGHVYASLVGELQLHETNGSFQAVVQSSKELASQQVLGIGQVVLAKVTRLTSMQTFVEIVAVDKVGLLQFPCEGSIRREDVRIGATEQVHMPDAFWPGDLVIARVLSLGDARRYFLTTAAAELGVIHALSKVSGEPMEPVSWKAMKCPNTGHEEPRKCARPPTTDVLPMPTV